MLHTSKSNHRYLTMFFLHDNTTHCAIQAQVSKCFMGHDVAVCFVWPGFPLFLYNIHIISVKLHVLYITTQCVLQHRNLERSCSRNKHYKVPRKHNPVQNFVAFGNSYNYKCTCTCTPPNVTASVTKQALWMVIKDMDPTMQLLCCCYQYYNSYAVY